MSIASKVRQDKAWRRWHNRKRIAKRLRRNIDHTLVWNTYKTREYLLEKLYGTGFWGRDPDFPEYRLLAVINPDVPFLDKVVIPGLRNILGSQFIACRMVLGDNSAIIPFVPHQYFRHTLHEYYLPGRPAKNVILVRRNDGGFAPLDISTSHEFFAGLNY